MAMDGGSVFGVGAVLFALVALSGAAACTGVGVVCEAAAAGVLSPWANTQCKGAVEIASTMTATSADLRFDGRIFQLRL